MTTRNFSTHQSWQRDGSRIFIWLAEGCSTDAIASCSISPRGRFVPASGEGSTALLTTCGNICAGFTSLREISGACFCLLHGIWCLRLALLFAVNILH